MGSQTPSAGWYQDPGGPGLRYWDGTQWTQHVRSHAQETPAAPAAAPPAPASVPAAGAPPAGWHPDPTHRHELRYWDGSTWSDDVATSSGWRGTDPVASGAAGPAPSAAAPGAPTAPMPAVAASAAGGGRPATRSMRVRPVALIGGVVVAASGLLPWVTVSGQSSNGFKLPAAFLFDDKTVSGAGFNMGAIMVIVGLVLAALAFVPAANAARRIVGVVSAGVMVWFVIQVARSVSDFQLGVSPFRVISVGVYAALVGSILAAAG